MRVLRCLLVALVVMMFLVPSAVVAGVGPSPFEPELNKLHSIELNLAAIKKRMESRSAMEILPAGTENYMLATANQLSGLDSRLGDVLAALPPASLDSQTRQEVVLALQGMRADLGGVAGATESGVIDLFESILSRLGIGPSPFRESLDSLKSKMTNYMQSLCPNGAVCEY